MKKLVYLFPILLLAFACGKTSKIDSAKTQTSTVNTLLDSWHKAAAESDFDRYFEMLDSSAIFIGTDATEIWDKPTFMAYAKEPFANNRGWNFTPLSRNVYPSSTVNLVYFDEVLKTSLGTCRGSGVAEKVKNDWKLKHYVLSMAIPNDNIEQVLSITHINDSIYQSQYK